MAPYRTPALLLLVALLTTSACIPGDRSSGNSQAADERGDCGPGRGQQVSAARALMDERVPSGPAVYKGAVHVCGVDEFEIGVGRDPPLEEAPSFRTSATVFFTPTVLVGEPAQEMRLLITHDGRSKTHSFTIDELGINEVLFSSDGEGLGTQTEVKVRFPTDGEPLLFYCRFHRYGGMWGALATTERYSHSEL
jgi:hypothetical protein